MSIQLNSSPRRRRIVGTRSEGTVSFDLLECDHTTLVTPSSGAIYRRCPECMTQAKEAARKRASEEAQ